MPVGTEKAKKRLTIYDNGRVSTDGAKLEKKNL